MRRTDPLIVGAGPAGTAAAIALARAGHRPLLLERDRTPRDPVCGGFIGPDALASLARLGLDPATLGARPITTLRLAAGQRTAEVALPFAAMGLSRRALDDELRTHAVQAGAGLEIGIAVRALEAGQLRLADGAILSPDALLLATGKHELRGAIRTARLAPDAAMGIRLALDPDPAMARELAGRVELILFDRGYAGLLVQEDGQVNLCLSVAATRLAATGSVEALLAALGVEAPLLGVRLGQARRQGPASTVARVPYGWIARQTDPGIYRLGDQAAVIASLAGDGVAIALASAAAAATALMQGESAADYQRRLATRAARPVRVAAGVRMLAERPIAALLLPLAARFPALVRSLATITRIEGY